jgi:Rod binding domain-containing protein
MNVGESISAPNTDYQRTKKLDATEKIRLQKAVREFESVFVGYMLKSMRSTVEKADNSNEGFGGELLESMFDVELAKHMSKNSNLGVAQMLYRRMTGEDLPGKTSVHGTGPDGRTTQRQNAENRNVMPKPFVQVNKSGSEPSLFRDRARPEPLASLLPKTAVRDAVSVAKANAPAAPARATKSLDERLNGLAPYIAEASEKHGVNENLIRAVIATESQARPNARSQKNAKGLMQLIDSTATEMGVKDVWDPRENILGGAKYLRHLLDRFEGDEKLALAGYNAGPANVWKHGGVPPFKETKQYVTRVMNFMKLFEEQGGEDE